MDSGVNWGSCGACGKTLSAHINTSKPIECKFVRKERKRAAPCSCGVCGESVPDSDAVWHYHPGAVISLDGS
mgnify:CR=1 FL=1